MEEKLMDKLQLIDYCQHLLEVNMELNPKTNTFTRLYREKYLGILDKIEVIIEECLNKIQSL